MKTKFKLTTEDRNFLLEQIRSIIHTEPFLQLKNIGIMPISPLIHTSSASLIYRMSLSKSII